MSFCCFIETYKRVDYENELVHFSFKVVRICVNKFSSRLTHNCVCPRFTGELADHQVQGTYIPVRAEVR